MINKLKNTIKYLRKVGIDDTYSLDEKLRIRTSNEIILIAFINLIVNETYLILTLSKLSNHLNLLIWAVIFGTAHICTKYKKHNLGRIIVLSSILIVLIILQILVGSSMCLEPAYAVFIYFVVLFYNKNVQNIVVISVILIYCGTMYINSIYPPPFEGLIYPLYHVTHVAILFIFLLYIMKRNMAIRDENDQILKEQEAELIEKNKQLNQFNYIVSHDLKEPIRSIVSFANLLKRNQHNKIKQKEFIDYITQSGYQLNHLIDGIKEYQELNEMRLNIEKVNLNRIVQEVKEQLNRDVKQQNISIFADNLPVINSANYPLTSVFKNIIDNGIRFNKSAHPSVKIWSKTDGEQLYIYFQDNGIGIEKEYQESVFEMFKRLGTDKTKNPGLGLNLCRRIIEKLDGQLYIENSIIGEGSTFCIALPYQNNDTSKRKQKKLAIK